MMRWRIGAVSAGMAALALAGCGDGSLNPRGDIELDPPGSRVAVGQTLSLTWTSRNTDKVHVRLFIDGSPIRMLGEDGFPADGGVAFKVDETLFAFDDDANVDMKFELLSIDPNNRAVLKKLDETRVVRIDLAPRGDG